MTKEYIEYAKCCVQEIRNWGDTASCCKDLESFIEQVDKLRKENEDLKAIDKVHQELVGELETQVKNLLKEREVRK